MKKIVLALVTVCTLFISCKKAVQQQPNVLFIAVDDLRTELGCYGAQQIKSPNIDRFAEEGVVFNRAYCNIPVCGASRASLLTSILPTKNRFIDYRAKAQEDVPNAKTLPGIFKEAGYTCISNGKVFHYQKDAKDKSWSESPWRPSRGSQAHIDPDSKKVLSKFGLGRIYEAQEVPDSVYPDYKIAQKTISDLKRLKASGEPFFLACGFYRPHLPFYVPKKYWDLYDREDIEIADNRFLPENAPKQLRGSGEFKTYTFGEYKPNTDDFHRLMRHGYYACVSYVDELVGQVLKELEELELDDNTIVVLWGDHGWHLGEHEFWGKHNTMHNALQVPLIVKMPGKAAGKKTQALVETIDIYPTLCDLAGLDVPEYVMGESFTPILEDPNKKFREAVYARFKLADAIITEGHNYSLYENGQEMLYDLKLDTQENKNVVSDLKHSELLKEMRNTLKIRQEQANSYK